MFDKRLFSLAPGVRGLIAAKVVCLWVGLLADIALSVTAVSLMGAVLGRNTAYTFTAVSLGWYALAFAIIALVRFLAHYLGSRFGTEAAERVKLGLRNALYEKLLVLGPSYRQQVSTASIVQLAGEGVDQVQSFYEKFVPQLFYAVLAPLTLFAVIAPINLPTAIVLLVCAPLIVIIVGMVAMRASRVFKKYWGKYTDMGSAFLDNLQGLETLKTFDADEATAKKMHEEAENFRVMTMRVLQIQLRSLTAMDVVAYGGAAAGIGVAIWQLTHGGVTMFRTTFAPLDMFAGPQLGSYRQQVSTASIVQLAGEGVDQVQSFYEKFVPQLFYAVLAPLTLFAVIAPINLPTAIVLLVCAPLIVIIVGMVAMRASRVFKKYWGKYTDMGSAFLDNLQGLETLKTFDADEATAKKMHEEAENFRVMTMRVLQIQLRSLTAMDVVAYGGAAAGIGVAIWQLTHGGVTMFRTTFAPLDMFAGPQLGLAGALLIVLLSASFFLPLRQLGSFFHVAMNGITSSKKIFALLDAPAPHHGEQTLPAGPISVHAQNLGFFYGDDEADAQPALRKVSLDIPAHSLTAIVGESGGITSSKKIFALLDAPAPHHGEQTLPAGPISVHAQNLGFFYGDDEADAQPALRKVSLDIPAHSLTAIVGESGSGKSTLAALIAGELEGYSGSLAFEVDGESVEVADLSESALMAAVSFVGARSHLFVGTLRDNLAMANPQATDEQLHHALRLAHIDDFVREQPAGLDMPIDPANLSGGQRQRIAVARALLHEAPIMIFDEATSSVDAESEALIMQTIHELAQSKTVIVVTPRLADTVDASSTWPPAVSTPYRSRSSCCQFTSSRSRRR